jgi:hypothetical protein
MKQTNIFPQKPVEQKKCRQTRSCNNNYHALFEQATDVISSPENGCELVVTFPQFIDTIMGVERL